MGIKFDKLKFSIKKRIEKNNKQKNGNQSWYKIKLNQILREKLKTNQNKIYSNQKIENKI
jgi:hypothetical protein